MNTAQRERAERRRKNLRIAAAVNAGSAGLNAGIAAFDFATGQLIGFLSLGIMAFSLSLAIRSMRKSSRLKAELSRPDYGFIASMEREIFGHARPNEGGSR